MFMCCISRVKIKHVWMHLSVKMHLFVKSCMKTVTAICLRLWQLLNPEASASAKVSEWTSRLSSMQNLLAVRSARQEQLSLAVTEFVRENLGAVFIERPAIDLPTL